MYDLHELTKEAARVISADSFEVIPKFKILESLYILDYITIYFKDSNISTLHSLVFGTEDKAIEGIKGFIQLYKNIE